MIEETAVYKGGVCKVSPGYGVGLSGAIIAGYWEKFLVTVLRWPTGAREPSHHSNRVTGSISM